jgi:hypothetical protein
MAGPEVFKAGVRRQVSALQTEQLHVDGAELVPGGVVQAGSKRREGFWHALPAADQSTCEEKREVLVVQPQKNNECRKYLNSIFVENPC